MALFLLKKIISNFNISHQSYYYSRKEALLSFMNEELKWKSTYLFDIIHKGIYRIVDKSRNPLQPEEWYSNKDTLALIAIRSKIPGVRPEKIDISILENHCFSDKITVDGVEFTKSEILEMLESMDDAAILTLADIDYIMSNQTLNVLFNKDTGNLKYRDLPIYFTGPDELMNFVEKHKITNINNYSVYTVQEYEGLTTVSNPSIYEYCYINDTKCCVRDLLEVARNYFG